MKRLRGTLLLDKPSGISSQGAVAVLRRASGERRVGHAGTLDPLATGLLVICFGPATRICEYLSGHDKCYEVTARLGVATATYDAEGEVTSTHSGPLPDDASIAEATRTLQGEQLQSPPAYSAVKVAGRPLYWHARRGAPVDVAPRPITVYSLAWSRPSPDTVALSLRCSSGTYVRSLVHDLGASLGCGAHVASLRRLSVGPFEVRDAVSLDAAEAEFRQGGRPSMLSIAGSLPEMPRLQIGADAALRLSRGQQVSGPSPSEAGEHLVIDERGEALAVVACLPESGLWRARKVFTVEEDA